MYRLIFILFLFLGSRANASGFDTIPFAKMDSITYSLYLKGDWEMLRNVGYDLIKQDVDWYYLRLRLAEAELQLNRPSYALKNISKAEVFSGRNSLTNDLLVRANLVRDCYQEALFVSSRDSSSEYFHALNKNKFLKQYDIEGVLRGSSLISQGLFTGARVGFTSYLNKRFSIYLSGQVYSQKNSLSDSLNNSNSIVVQQRQVYGKAKMLLSPAFSLFGGAQYSVLKYEKENSTNYIAFVGTELRKPFMNYKLSAASTNFKGDSKIIGTLSITAFPLGNLNFYPWMNFSNVYCLDSLTNSPVVDFGVGGKLMKNVWADIFFSPLAYEFHTLNDYEVVFNVQDKVNHKLGFGLSYYGFKHTAVKFNYSRESMQLLGAPSVLNYTQNTITLCISRYR